MSCHLSLYLAIIPDGVCASCALAYFLKTVLVFCFFKALQGFYKMRPTLALSCIRNTKIRTIQQNKDRENHPSL